MKNRTEAKLKSIEGMKNAMTEILAQAWERGRKYGRLEALENSSHIIDALEKLKDETMDAIVKFGIEKSIECIRQIKEENA